MRLYLDTEFNGFDGELIALALISPRGHSFYEACAPSVPIVDWVQKNVIPKLNKDWIPPWAFKQKLHAFLLTFDNPEIMCDWHADAEHFCRALAGHDYGSSLDYACRITILRTPLGQPVSKNPHNALDDAQALMEWNEARLAAA